MAAHMESKGCTKEAERRAKIEADLKQRLELERNAFNLVGKMLDNPITEDMLADAGQSIMKEHYDDIIEERSLTKTCGYPLCSKTLGKVTKQKYHISTKTNKVYDITERKKFCSNQCFKASEYFASQISSAPLWSRKAEGPVKFTFLQVDAIRGAEGHEVISKAEEVRKEVEMLNKLDHWEEKLSVKKENVAKCLNDSEFKHNYNKHSNDAEELSKSVNKLNISSSISENPQAHEVPYFPPIMQSPCNDNFKKSVQTENSCEEIQEKPNIPVSMPVSVCVVEQEPGNMIQNQNSLNNLKIHSGSSHTDQSTEQKLQKLMHLLDKRQKLKEKADQSKVKSNDAQIVSTVVQSNATKEPNKDLSTNEKIRCDSNNLYLSNATKEKVSVKKEQTKVSALLVICTAIKTWITEETRQFVYPKQEDSSQYGTSSVPKDFEVQYQALCQRVDLQEADMTDVIGESEMQQESLPSGPLPDYVVLKEEMENYTAKVGNFLSGKTAVKPINEKSNVERTPVYLPTVDSHDQTLIRQKIVTERINKCIPELLDPLVLTMQDVFSDLKGLISTFRFTSQNILFKPAEWTLISMLMLNMLRHRNKLIKEGFGTKRASKYFEVVLQAVGESMDSLNSHTESLLK